MALVRRNERKAPGEEGPALTDPLVRGVEAHRLICQGLADTIDLVVMFTLRERQQLGFKFGKVSSISTKVYKTSFEFGCLDKHPLNLVSLNGNSLDAIPSRLTKFLGKRGASGRVFDEDKCRLILISKRNGHIAELRIFIATAGYIEQIIVALIDDQPCRAD